MTTTAQGLTTTSASLKAAGGGVYTIPLKFASPTEFKISLASAEYSGQGDISQAGWWWTVSPADNYYKSSFGPIYIGNGESNFADINIYTNGFPQDIFVTPTFSIDYYSLTSIPDTAIGLLDPSNGQTRTFTGYFGTAGGVFSFSLAKNARVKVTAIALGEDSSSIEPHVKSNIGLSTSNVYENDNAFGGWHADYFAGVDPDSTWPPKFAIFEVSLTVSFLTSTPTGQLFTDDANGVDFNNLWSDQHDAIASSPTPDLYHAMGGDDWIALPRSANAADLAGTGIAYDLSRTFFAGDGADTIDFSQVNWSADYPAASFGGEGHDIPIDGGGQPDALADGFKAGARVDTIKLSGAPSDYTFMVDFGTDSIPGAPTWETTHTYIQTPTARLDTTDFEKVVFATLGGAALTNVVALTENSVYVEMARLARDVYGDTETFAHRSEKLADGFKADGTYDAAGPLTLGSVGPWADPLLQNWHPVAAVELGMAPADYGHFGSLRYTLVNGFYAAIDTAIAAPDPFGLLQPAEANALVLTGLVHDAALDKNLKTLCVVFRGTDQYDDFWDYVDMGERAYSKFHPLVEALKTYAAAGGFDQVLISGHSLGGSMAQLFAADLAGTISSQKIQVFTFGSPGAETGTTTAGFVDFVHTDDIVPWVGHLTTLPPAQSVPVKAVLTGIASAALLVYADAKYGPLLGPGYAAAAATALVGYVTQMKEKNRAGWTAALDSEISSNASVFDDTPIYSVLEHALEYPFRPDMGPPPFGFGYINDIIKLVSYARETAKDAPYASPFREEAFAKALADNKPYADLIPQVAVGNGTLQGRAMTSRAGDAYALGDMVGDNVIVWKAGGSDLRIIDGGPGGGDKLLVPDPVHYDLVADSGYWDLVYRQTSEPDAVLAHVFRIEGLAWRPLFSKDIDLPFDPALILRRTNGAPTTVQRAMPGETSLVVDGSADVAYAGQGVDQVTSTAPGAMVVYSAGVGFVDVSGSGSIVASDGTVGANPVEVDTGDGAVVVLGGPGAEHFRAHAAGAQFEGGGGDDVLDYSAVTGPLSIDIGDGVANSENGSDSFTAIGRVVGTAAGDTSFMAAGDGHAIVGQGDNNRAVYPDVRARYDLWYDNGVVAVEGGPATDRLSDIQALQFADRGLKLMDADGVRNRMALADLTSGRTGIAIGDDYAGPVAGLDTEFIKVTDDNLNIGASVPNTFIHTGAGMDAIQALGGRNVLDGGTGSNFLTGATGEDTFFLDDRDPASDIWSTVVAFGKGDSATVWGVNDKDFAVTWQDGLGAAGFTGLTMQASAPGRPAALLTLAGYGTADIDSGRLIVAFGQIDAATPYLWIYGST